MSTTRIMALDDISFHNCEKDFQRPGGEAAEKLDETDRFELYNDVASFIWHKVIVFYIAMALV